MNDVLDELANQFEFTILRAIRARNVNMPEVYIRDYENL